jgi:flagellar basal body-associated protein FliL
VSRGLTIALVASILVLALSVGGLAAYVFFRQPAVTMAATEGVMSEKKGGSDEADAGAFLKLKNFVTDLADKDRLRYVDVSISLGLKDEKAVEEAKKIEPAIRDHILGQLRKMTSAELAGAQGKEKLAETLQKGLSELMRGQLKAVYVTDLVVQ